MFDFIRTFLSRAALCAGLLVLVQNGHAQSGRLGLQLPPSTFGQSLSVQQQLTVERQDQVNLLEAALEIDATRIDLVCMALGRRVLTLHFDGERLQKWRHLMLPPELRAEHVLEDIQLTLWPADAIRKALPDGWRLEEQGLTRTLLWEDKPVAVIEYSGEPRWSGTTTLSNLRYDYRLTIRTAVSRP